MEHIQIVLKYFNDYHKWNFQSHCKSEQIKVK